MEKELEGVKKGKDKERGGGIMYVSKGNEEKGGFCYSVIFSLNNFLGGKKTVILR